MKCLKAWLLKLLSQHVCSETCVAFLTAGEMTLLFQAARAGSCLFCPSLYFLYSLPILFFSQFPPLQPSLYVYLKKFRVTRVQFSTVYCFSFHLFSLGGLSLPRPTPDNPKAVTNPILSPNSKPAYLPVTPFYYPHVPLTDLMNFPHRNVLPLMFCI